MFESRGSVPGLVPRTTQPRRSLTYIAFLANARSLMSSLVSAGLSAAGAPNDKGSSWVTTPGIEVRAAEVFADRERGDSFGLKQIDDEPAERTSAGCGTPMREPAVGR